MINLLELNRDIETARKEHENFMLCFIFNRLSGSSNNTSCNNYSTHFPKKTKIYNPDLYSFIVDFLVNNILTILSGIPIELQRINTIFESLFDAELNNIYRGQTSDFIAVKRKESIEDLKSILDYSGFFLKLTPTENYSAYHLAKNLDIRSCTYCNRVYTVTHNTKAGDKLMRPQFDHWFPKSKYPLLALSFYNLIPSCSHCNSSVKGDKELDLSLHIHPYIKNPVDDSFVFSYDFNKSTDDYEIKLVQKGMGSKQIDTLQFLKIDEMYDAHYYELDDLIKMEQAYSGEYLKKLKESFPGANLTDEQIYRYAFGTELNEENFHKRPMSKFKYDILKELGIIK